VDVPNELATATIAAIAARPCLIKLRMRNSRWDERAARTPDRVSLANGIFPAKPFQMA
jgi:hypothetical protein